MRMCFGCTLVGVIALYSYNAVQMLHEPLKLGVNAAPNDLLGLECKPKTGAILDQQ